MAEDFVRYIVPDWISRTSQRALGVLGAAYILLDRGELPPELHADLARAVHWFEQHLDVPDRFNRTRSKGWYRRETRGIAWLRTTATQHVGAMARLAELIEHCGYRTAELRAKRIGYVTYEDDVQVIAEPFHDTPTR